MAKPATLVRAISPPPTGRESSRANDDTLATVSNLENQRAVQGKTASEKCDPPMAAIEAGEVEIQHHLEYFSQKLASLCRPTSAPRLSMEDYMALYIRNQHENGRHFVVHQHDHPVSGVHYDLRLQFSDSSTISFAIPYGLPGNPNSIRPNRMAIETRIHCLWNNLIESASHDTGSLLIWDTGEYEILPWKAEMAPMTDDENSDADFRSAADRRTDSERLFSAFQGRHIRLRLHGTRLPHNYTIGLRLPTKNDRTRQPKKPNTKRRRLEPSLHIDQSRTESTDSESEQHVPAADQSAVGDDRDNDGAGIASDNEEDSAIRENNAYPGATNSIRSIHQRHWFLSLDQRRSGFTKTKGSWVGRWEPFFVRGRDHERSVVTGRTADDVMEDEGVEAFVGRKLWRPILE